MIPIYIKSEAKTEASGCIVKVLERIINTRFKWFPESVNLLASEQAGFLEHHCTGDQTTYLAQEIEDGFLAQKTNSHCMDRSTESI